MTGEIEITGECGNLCIADQKFLIHVSVASELEIFKYFRHLFYLRVIGYVHRLGINNLGGEYPGVFRIPMPVDRCHCIVWLVVFREFGVNENTIDGANNYAGQKIRLRAPY